MTIDARRGTGFLSNVLSVAIAAVMLICPFPAEAQDRVALVIGNGKYRHATALLNPPNDARDIAKALREIGFEVAEGRHLDRAGMERQLRDFLRKAASAHVALLFYAGHGMQVDGRNYLVPVDAKLEAASDLGFETIELDKILDNLNDPARANIVILDACRDNPLARSFAARLRPTRSGAVSTGLAAYSTLGTGTLIAFATAPGQVALDGQGNVNSPFTQGLIKHLRMPGLEVRQMLTRVRADVAAATRNRQIPWDNSSLLGEVYLVPPAIAADPSGDKPSVASGNPAARAWEAVKDTKDKTLLEAFLKEFQDGFYATLARARLKGLTDTKVAVGTFPEPPKAAPEQQYKPGDTFKDCDACPEMMVVPAGSFMMGSPSSEKDRETDEGPQHRVTIAKPFAAGKFEVTFAQWDACVAEGGCNRHRPDDRGWGRGRQPVINMSWNDAKAYVAWLSRKAGKSYRLLSEAEWEYAARAGTTSSFSCGDADTCLGIVAWYYGASSSRTRPVGEKSANDFGLHDLHGNVSEWTEDCWNESYAGAPADGTAWTSGNCSRHVLRGGSWIDYPGSLRSANRNSFYSDYRFNDYGFRVARTLTLAPADTASSIPATPTLSDSALVHEIKKELKRVGCYAGPVDDKWTTADTKAAVQKFAKLANLRNSVVEPETSLLDAIRGKPERVCPIARIPGAGIPSDARVFKQEPPTGVGAIGFGEVAYVDDGTCAKGRILQITGGSKQKGIGRKRKCVPR